MAERAHDFRDVLAKMRTVRRNTRTLSFPTLIAAKDTLFLMAFTLRILIRPRMVKFEPFLAAIRVLMGARHKWRADAHDFWNIAPEIRPFLRPARKLSTKL